MSVRSTSPIMSQSDVQVIPMEEHSQRRPSSWSEVRGRHPQGSDPFSQGFDEKLAPKGN